MKFPLLTLVVAVLLFAHAAPAQKRRPPTSPTNTRPARSVEIGQSAIVVDETLSVLRKSPSLFSESVHRMQRGRKIQILGVTEADGVKFYKVTAPPTSFGWVQADAVFGKFRPDDEGRLAKLVQAIDGFDQVEIAGLFFELYPNSKLKPQILMLYGDILEEWAARLTKDANSQLKRLEMAASAAPLHSYYLNFVRLDRFRRLGIIFVFNSATRTFHYDGASWKEIVAKFPTEKETAEAQKRLDNLKAKMEKPVAAK